MKRGGDSTGSRWTPHGPRLSAETAPDRITLRRWLDDTRAVGQSREDAAAGSRFPGDPSLPWPGRRGALPGAADLGGVRVPARWRRAGDAPGRPRAEDTDRAGRSRLIRGAPAAPRSPVREADGRRRAGIRLAVDRAGHRD